MKLNKPILTPDKNRKPFFDGDNLKSGCYEFKCSKCNNIMFINGFSIYTGAWDKYFSETATKKIEEFLSFESKQSISENGGWVSITMHYCSNCGMPHLAVADFDEYHNSLYRITMQAIVPCW